MGCGQPRSSRKGRTANSGIVGGRRLGSILGSCLLDLVFLAVIFGVENGGTVRMLVRWVSRPLRVVLAGLLALGRIVGVLIARSRSAERALPLSVLPEQLTVAL